MIAIIDYGMGNLHSVSQALERKNHPWRISADPDVIRSADGVILPGVGAFGDAMMELKQRDLITVIKEVAREGKPLLGICLGMQLLFTGSDEHGYHQGLNLLPGHVVRFKGNYKIPHMGWNELRFERPHPFFQGIEDGYAYFVHSYHVLPDNAADILAMTDYYQPVTAMVGRGNLFGMQFHPEKSGETGRRLLNRFADLCRERVGLR